MSNEVQLFVSIASLVILLASVGVAAATYLRGGGWNAKAERDALSRTLSSHDQRLSTLEQRCDGFAPSIGAIQGIKTSVDLLQANITGKLETMNVRLEHADRERATQHSQNEKDLSAQGASIKRIEQFLLEKAA